ncbi:tyrosine--tRNA ligase, partial [Candidatus Saccharibacteria bacterium]|nr:tyrosine--tRNA ligase [Candidatus Saccharibacteria bacterium]
MTKMTLSEELTWRGFINQTTFKDIKELDKEKRTFYHGFDASADSQTIGNLAAMMFDKVFIRHGYKAILLAGGATSLIGDPGGKDIERPMQSEDTILHNVAMAEKQLKQIFREDTFTLVNNLDWIKSMSTIEFLRDVGKYFGMSTLVQRDYIQKRIGDGGSGMSYTEFSYTLLQGYDFLHLYRKYGCTLQLAGSDQWGNSLSGVDLIRKIEGQETHVITLPLIINKATGKKFGKSEEGAIWLDSEKTSSYKFYQFWLNVDDEGVGDYIKIYTLIAPEEFDTLMQEFQANPSDRSAQKYLAYEVTKLVHGEESAQSAKNVTA